jgi:hypothetical protein
VRPQIPIAAGERQFWRIVNASPDLYADLQVDGEQLESSHWMECPWPSTIQHIPWNMCLIFSCHPRVEWKQSSPAPNVVLERHFVLFALIRAVMEIPIRNGPRGLGKYRRADPKARQAYRQCPAADFQAYCPQL